MGERISPWELLVRGHTGSRRIRWHGSKLAAAALSITVLVPGSTASQSSPAQARTAGRDAETVKAAEKLVAAALRDVTETIESPALADQYREKIATMILRLQ